MKLLLFFTVCLLNPFALSTMAEDHFNGADDLVRAAMQHWEVPGAAIAVVRDGKVVFARGYGVTEIGTSNPVDHTTSFDIASLAKTITAASVAVLVDQGQLNWDDRVSQHLPAIRFPDRYMTQNVTLRDLLCHRTGLATGDMIFSQQNMTRDRLLDRTQSLTVAAPFRTQLTYNNVLYSVLREVVTARAGQSWERFVQEKLFVPLKMRDTKTTSLPLPIDPKNRQNFAPRHWHNEGTITSRGMPTSGGTYSSVDDMAKWMLCQLNYGRSTDAQIITERSIREMHALQQSVPVRTTPADNPYAARFYGAGLGWMTMDYRSRKLVFHTGAWGAILGIVPEENVGVVVLTNLDWNYGMSSALMFRFLDALCEKSDSVWRTDNLQHRYLEAPRQAYRRRDTARVELETTRKKDTKPTLQLTQYAGQYQSSFFGEIRIGHQEQTLSLRIGQFTTELRHWENDVFYAKSPTRMNYDWLLGFEIDNSEVQTLTLQYVGWHEPEMVFQRVSIVE